MKLILKKKKTVKRRTQVDVIRQTLSALKYSKKEIEEAVMKHKEMSTRQPKPTLTNEEKYKVAAALTEGKLVFRTETGKIRVFDRKEYVKMSERGIRRASQLNKKS